MHSQHPEPQLVRGRKSSQPHEGCGHRTPETLSQLLEFFSSIGTNYPTTGIYNRLFGLTNGCICPFDLTHVGLGRWFVTLQGNLLGRLVLGLGIDDVLGQVHQDGTRSPGTRQIKGLTDDPGEIMHVLH